MLKKANRIGKKDFSSIMKDAKSRTSTLFSFRASKKFFSNKGFNFSVVVSKKVARNASIRNLIRRRAYNAIDDLIKKDGSKFKGSGIFIAKNSVSKASFQDIKKEIASFLHE